jgi:predicted metal-dependent hydrolase
MNSEGTPFTVEPFTVEPFRVEVVRSTRRKRTVGAELKGGVLKVAVPSWMSAAEEAHWVERMSASFRRKASSERIDLRRRAATLARRYGLPEASDIRWSDDMTTRWGSCTPASGTIRISNRLAPFPDWVIDYVIVHELCHLRVRGHGPGFWQLVGRYPRSERAIGYLIAKSGEHDGDPAVDPDGAVDLDGDVAVDGVATGLDEA